MYNQSLALGSLRILTYEVFILEPTTGSMNTTHHTSNVMVSFECLIVYPIIYTFVQPLARAYGC